MAEELLDVLGVDISGEEQGGASVPEVVRSYIGKTGAFEEPSGRAVSKIGGVKDAQCGVFPESCSRPHKPSLRR